MSELEKKLFQLLVNVIEIRLVMNRTAEGK
jgi:hypothetical protein